MKKNVFFAIPFVIVVLLSSISCRTTPPVVTEEVCLEEINQLIAQVEEARKRAMDFQSPAYFPSDWEAVEAEFYRAKAMPKTTEEEVQEATELLTAILETYNAIFRKTIPLYAQVWEDEIMAVRDELIRTGLRAYFPEHLQRADIIALTALEQYEAGDYYIARDTAATALNEYETLLLGARIILRQQELTTRGFDQFDPEGFEYASKVALTALEKHEAGDTKAARGYAETALELFDNLLRNGWRVFAYQQRDSAAGERATAIYNRVNIAMRDAFREADLFFTRAEDGFARGNFEEAAILYTEAEALFVIAGQETQIRRQRAQEAIRRAEETIEDSYEIAVEAERLIEGGVR